MEIAVSVHHKFSSRVDRSRLRRIVRRTVSMERSLRADSPRRPGRDIKLPSNSGLAVYVTTDFEIRQLNRKFHLTNKPTDVLSFPSYEQNYLGDIVISYDRARIQAREAGWRVSDELELLTVHGALHLLGYDDRTARERERMWKRQDGILRPQNLNGPRNTKRSAR